jgi:hypothetical protein
MENRYSNRLERKIISFYLAVGGIASIKRKEEEILLPGTCYHKNT